MPGKYSDMTVQELLDHFITSRGKGDLYEQVPLLLTAASSEAEIFHILERIRDDGKTLKAYYPAIDKDKPRDEYIGEIEDGELYLVPVKK